MKLPEVTVIIPTYNKEKYLELSLASWLHQQFGREYEIIVVDDGCTDCTLQLLRRYSQSLPLRFESTGNKGRAAARNLGLQLARGPLVVFVDDDRIVPPDFLERHWGAHEKSAPAGIVIGWTSGLLVELPGPGDQLIPERVFNRVLARDPAISDQLLAGKELQILKTEHFQEAVPRLDELALLDPWENQLTQVVSVYGTDITECPLAWTYGTTGNLSVPREALERSGGFDEAFNGWGLEDTELHYRLVRAGLRTKIERRAVNYHQNHPKNRRSQMLNWQINAKRMLLKHQSDEAVALYIQAAVGNVSIVEACKLLPDRQSPKGSHDLAVYRDLLVENARRLLEC